MELIIIGDLMVAESSVHRNTINRKADSSVAAGCLLPYLVSLSSIKWALITI